MNLCVCVCLCYARFAQQCLTLFDPIDCKACQAPLSMGFSRQGYWRRLPIPPAVNLPDPGIKPTSLLSPALAGEFSTTAPPGKSKVWNKLC